MHIWREIECKLSRDITDLTAPSSLTAITHEYCTWNDDELGYHKYDSMMLANAWINSRYNSLSRDRPRPDIIPCASIGSEPSTIPL